MLGNRVRVLDSTPIYGDAVSTQDTVTQLRSAIRKLLGAMEGIAESKVRGVVADDDYAGRQACV